MAKATRKMSTSKNTSRSKVTKSKNNTLRRIKKFSTSQLLVFIFIFAAIGGYIIYKSFASPATKSSGAMSWNQIYSQMLENMDTPEPYGAHAINTTGCVWNDGDQFENYGAGSVTGTTTNTQCLVADIATGEEFYPKSAIFQVFSPTDTLSVSLANDAGSSWSSPPAIKTNKGYVYQLCINDPVAIKGGVQNGNTTQLLNTWPLIPNTNGGYGQIVHYTLSLTSLKGTTSKVTAYWFVGINGNSTAEVPYIESGNIKIPCPPRNQVSL